MPVDAAAHVPQFARYELRTSDVAGAESFYAAVCGGDFWSDGIIVSALPPRIAALGVPPHWLGHVAVRDVTEAFDAATESQWQAVGPPGMRPVPGAPVQVRDPAGANLALMPAPAHSPRSRGIWHLHHSRSMTESLDVYHGLFGWSATPDSPVTAPGLHARAFAWEEGGEAAGTMISTDQQHIHPQWLFFFAVDQLESATETIVARGGMPAGPVMQTSAGRLLPCEDPHGAAFGVWSPT